MARDKGKPKIVKVVGEEETTYVADWAVGERQPMGLLLGITYVADESGTKKRS